MKRRFTLTAATGGLAAVALFGLAAVVEGCADARGTDEDDGELYLARLDYPVTGGSGQKICAEWRSADGEVMHREQYSFDDMNAFLSEDSPEAAAIREKVSSVVDCASARQFVKLRDEQLADEPDEVQELPLEAAPEPLEDDYVQKIAEGVNATKSGVVLIRTWPGICTGWLLNGRFLMTAAHCFPNNNNREITVQEGNSPTTDCIYPDGANCDCNPRNDAGPGGCAPQYGWVKVRRFNGYAGETGKDLALVELYKSDATWGYPASLSTHWFRWLYTKPTEGNYFFLWGYGTNKHSGGTAGVSRRTYEQDIDWHGNWHFYSYAVDGYGKPCSGDSGGPYINENIYSRPIVIGSHSNHSGGSACTYDHEKFRGANFSYSDKVNWIDDTVDMTCTHAGANNYLEKGCCEFSSVSGGKEYWYKRCW